MSVKNEFPTIDMPYRLAIIGEAPGQYEVSFGRPFQGPSGKLLDGALNQNGIMRNAVFTGYLCQEEPPQNDISLFDRNGREIQEGLYHLRKDLHTFNPNAVLLLGRTTLFYFGCKHPVNDFRGSLFEGVIDGYQSNKYKCIASYHPATILRQWDDAPLFNLDVAKAVRESYNRELKLPQRELLVELSPAEVLAKLKAIQPGDKISIDIEGGVPNPHAKKADRKFVKGVTCCSIATSPHHAFIVPFEQYEGSVWRLIMREFARVMKDGSIIKVLQNGLYDFTVLAWHFKIVVNGIEHDTMLSGWEIYPELPKALGVQTSVWTDEPFYKYERTINDHLTHYRYCCKDSAVTYEIHEKQLACMTDAQKEHYTFLTKLLPSLQFMSLKGMRYDADWAKSKLREVKAQQLEMQTICDSHAGGPINMNSPKQMCDLLYKKLRFPPQYKKEGGRKTQSLTQDKEALLKLVVKTQHPFLINALGWRKLDGFRKQLEYRPDSDGRMRCSYNVVGTDTGRLSCSGFVTGNGTNLTTATKKWRQAFVADPGHYFFQCDLEGADGWTVAARCYDLGDPTMLDDYKAGLKPAKIIALMKVVGSHVSSMSREEIKTLIKTTPLPSGLYDVCKVVQHGSNYLMQPRTMSDQVLEKSFSRSDDSNLLILPPSVCEEIQYLYFKRYPGVPKWQKWIENELLVNQSISSASGNTRMFFGRPGDRATLGAAVSHEPQNNTTYVTNRAMLNLWEDPENRKEDGSLIIQPLHSVHDALCGQFPIELTDWATAKIRSYFDIPIKIGSLELVIPFEGGYANNWYETNEDDRIGSI